MRHSPSSEHGNCPTSQGILVNFMESYNPLLFSQAAKDPYS